MSAPAAAVREFVTSIRGAFHGQRATGRQDAPDLCERGRWVGNGAEHERGDHGVEAAVRERQRLGPDLEHVDRHPELRCPRAQAARPRGLGPVRTSRVTSGP